MNTRERKWETGNLRQPDEAAREEREVEEMKKLRFDSFDQP